MTEPGGVAILSKLDIGHLKGLSQGCTAAAWKSGTRNPGLAWRSRPSLRCAPGWGEGLVKQGAGALSTEREAGTGLAGAPLGTVVCNLGFQGLRP